ncbi:MAG: serine/threonine-protein kinase [Luteolibacter sp.]
MPERNENIAYCHACGSPMDVTSVAPFSNVSCPGCGKHTRVKREFGPYTLTRRHAVGGMSMVFVAQDHTLDREVALKILSEEYSADERRITAFEEEARITASFSHPHVVRVLRTGKAFGRFYIAMELVPGGHFEHQIRERGKIPEVEMLPLAIQVAQGLKAAHAAGLIHRDVKPGNILLDGEGNAKLVDFGLALVTHGGKAQATELWATPYYVPPETIEGAPEDFRSDIYAFGATVYHALAGHPSCGEETMATDFLREAKLKVVPLSIADPTISADTCRIIERAMAYDPKDRFGSYDEMIFQLEAAAKRLKTGAPSAAEVSQIASRRRAEKKRTELVLFSSVSLVLLVAIGGGVWWVTRKEPAKAVKEPVRVEPIAVVPEQPSSIDIVKTYREAHGAVVSREFEKATQEFLLLLQNPAVQEPTRTWAGIEGVVGTYLSGDSKDALQQAKACSDHVNSLPDGSSPIGKYLVRMLGELGKLPALPGKSIDSSSPDASHVMGWMLAGLKDWDQGAMDQAVDYFSAVAGASLSGRDQWVAVYQDLARDYLADHQLLSGPVFEGFPSDQAGCETAVKELDQILSSLKTRGRARYNVRAWQLDLTRTAKLLANAKEEAAKTPVPEAPPAGLSTVMANLSKFADACEFPKAADYLKTLPSDPQGAKVASLLALADSAGVFLSDIEQDLGKGAVAVELVMKSGESMRRIAVEADRGIVTTDASGQTHPQAWRDFSPEALIEVHRVLIKSPRSESERLRRHQCAIAFDWLTGNHEHALSAAATLSQSSTAFKQQWETIASGLPK